MHAYQVSYMTYSTKGLEVQSYCLVFLIFFLFNSIFLFKLYSFLKNKILQCNLVQVLCVPTLCCMWNISVDCALMLPKIITQ